MAYDVKFGWDQFYHTDKLVNVPACPLKWNAAGYASTTNTPSDYVLNYASGRSTPFQVSVHASRVSDWYANKPWIDASAIPAVRSATRLNATVSFNAMLKDISGEQPDKVLPIAFSLNATIPDVDVFTDDDIKNLMAFALGALFTTQDGKDPLVDFLRRYKGVLVPSGIITPDTV